jgi:hypothetical protein
MFKIVRKGMIVPSMMMLKSLAVTKDFQVDANMILQQWQARKLHGNVAVHELVKSRHMFALKGCSLVRDLICEENTANLAAEILKVQTSLLSTLRRFRDHETINDWLEQFAVSNYGSKHRFRPLLLVGGTQQGKTSKALSIFGHMASVKVCCQGLPNGVIPSIREFDRLEHKCIIWDECRYDQVLGNKEVMMSPATPIVLQQSQCNQHSFTKWLYMTAHILCSNHFPMTVEEGLTPEEADWLSGNLFTAKLPVGQAWFL